MTSQDARTAAPVAELNAMAREELVELFLTLPSVDLPGLVGEFEGHTPDYLRERFAATADVDGYGAWLGIGPPVGPDDPRSEVVDARG